MMTMLLKKQKLEIGQVIPLVVLMMFVIIGIIALILDGGAVISNRRTAQAAADAGALAGAQRACHGFGDAATVASTYATNNGATAVEIPLATSSQVTVVATVENDSFFARIFGVDSLPATADATAGCYGLIGKGVVPLAFHCEKETIGAALPNPDMYDCIMLGLDWKEELKPILSGQTKVLDGTAYHLDGTDILDASGIPPVNRMYIIMDSNKLCISDGGTIDCDISVPKDGKDDLKFGGQRSWLYLDPSINSLANYVKTIGSETNITIRSHRWLTGDSGSMASGYNHMISNGWVGSVVLLPVYNVVCTYPQTNTACFDSAHAGDWPPVPPWGDDFSGIRLENQDNYHILAFAPFYISCIDTKADCPGYQYALNLYGDKVLDKNEPIIEGFFITNYDDILPDSASTCELNLGNCVISLSD